MPKEMCFRAAFESTTINGEERDPKNRVLGQEFLMTLFFSISVLGSHFVYKAGWRKDFFFPSFC